MRPQLIAAENVLGECIEQPARLTSMRPQLIAAENLRSALIMVSPDRLQ